MLLLEKGHCRLTLSRYSGCVSSRGEAGFHVFCSAGESWPKLEAESILLQCSRKRKVTAAPMNKMEENTYFERRGGLNGRDEGYI